MMFIVRSPADTPEPPDVRTALTRRTPSILPDSAGQIDRFCLGDEAAMQRLSEQGWLVVPLRDGWYADDTGGGVAIWGQGLYWEIRDTPFSVKEGVGPAAPAAGASESPGETLDVRKGIFGV